MQRRRESPSYDPPRRARLVVASIEIWNIRGVLEMFILILSVIMIMPILGSDRPVTRHPGPRTGDPHHMRHQGEILTGAALPQIKTFQSNA